MNSDRDEAAMAGRQFEHDTSGRYPGCFADAVRVRAYAIYLARGDRPGSAEEDWLQAERELKHHFGL